MSKRRVVVTGLGVVTPLATGVQATWSRLINAECGIRRITQFDVSDLPAKIAGNVQRGQFHLSLSLLTASSVPASLSLSLACVC
jgi:3-oxoacyl-(acyl-carrier-protein) synthase